ncbi:hypothetical protein HB825_11815 [Listeria booriae]|uniref:Uncharacterized protein n=1 Tax=Listeria booriae TaxID=1552123 RepID=A0A7X0ZPX3_9LIST|nr:hypothetical protein [Listeria booriae]MBC1490714.1 hypothetical protein [Listeria booriae]MBC1503750.1 hypothetical protein [Listeria booriae]MBC1512131.1 hypothetical protein [Listeria booriae]MBC2034643.1 hypothetical protein [Listeria booriae]MBC2283562.1 hypothetical protein [Listeria booriae]
MKKLLMFSISIATICLVFLAFPKASYAYGPTNITYKITSKTIDHYGYGVWRAGPSGKGAATLTFSNSSGSDRSFTASISGDYPIGAATIGSSVGVTIGKSKAYSASYSITIPKGKKQQIIFRSRYKVINVKQRMYANGMATNTYKTAKVTAFVNWDYSWKDIK